MDKTEKMILSDAIKTAIKAEKEKVLWRNISILLLILSIYFAMIIVLGG